MLMVQATVCNLATLLLKERAVLSNSTINIIINTLCHQFAILKLPSHQLKGSSTCHFTNL